MAIQIQLRRGTAAEWATANTVLALAEMGIETDTKLFKIGDGSTHWTDLAYGGIKGDKGADSTVQGPKGDKGEVGSKGDKGTDGSKGDKGDTGTTGAKGDTGTTGSKGDKGDTGATGPSGSIGTTGSKGDKGDAGTNGTDGSKGDKGDTGSKGDQGGFGGASFYYDFSTNTANTDPTSGWLKFNNASLASATIMWIDPTEDSETGAGTDVSSFLQTIDDSSSAIKGHFRIAELANNSNYAIFAITGNHAEYSMPGGWFEIPVTYISGSVTTFTNATETFITFARTGDAGDKGQKGDAGYIGADGAAGAKGDKGDVGAQGTTGSTGLKGDKGDTGSKGDKGDTGTAGSKGDTGDKGSTGDKGDTGAAGAKGDAGAIGAVDITFDSYVGNGSNTVYTLSTTPVGENYTIVVVDGITQLRSDYSVVGATLTFSSAVPDGALIEVSTLAGGAKGEKGEAAQLKGDKGDKGVDGVIGVDGTKGQKGDTGSTGPTGTTGSKGDKGDAGTNGSAGSKGDKGDTGSAGSKGDAGVEKTFTASGSITAGQPVVINANGTVSAVGYTPLTIGMSLDGGYYAGMDPNNASNYLIVAPKANEYVVDVGGESYSTFNTAVGSATIGGYTGWSTPTPAQLRQLFTNFKPTTTLNYTANPGAWGGGSFSAWSAGSPTQTSVAAFQSSAGAEYFQTGTGDWYYTNVQDGGGMPYVLRFDDGMSTNYGDSWPGYSKGIIRPVASRASVTRTTNLNYNTIGFATNTVSSGATVTVSLTGPRYSGATGLSPATIYYTAANGSLVTTSTNTAIAGLAISNTELILSDNSFNAIAGDKGQKGDTGTTGSAGSKGDKGDTGTTGTKGDVGPIGGSNTQVVFNDSATANGASTLTFNKTTNAFGAPNTTITGYANVSSTLQVTGITTLNANIVLGTTTITANGSVGSAGAVLTSGATGNVYWASASGGGATLTANSTDTQTFYLPMSNATSGSWSNAVVSTSKLYFVPSTGTLNSTIFNSLSDETQKTNKQRIVDALSKLKQLGGYTYMLIDSNEPSAGLLAQQVQLVLPEAITYDPVTGLLRLNYNAVMALVVESINELETRVGKLEDNA